MSKKSVNYQILSSKLFLGVDGGGTKTHVYLIDENKRFVCEGVSGPSNPLRVGVETAVSNIIHAVDAACDNVFRSPNDIVAAMLGLAGVRRMDIRESIRRRIMDAFATNEVGIATDADIALYGTTLGRAGLVIISGTGSVCLGMDDDGKTAMSGGWGPTAGDEGGGISIARQGLQAIAKALDGRGRETKLKDIGAEYFRASTPDDLVVAIYSPQMDNAKLAGFARHVVETARAGDELAIEILAIAGFELGLAACAVIKKLHLENRKIPIGMVGSIFKAGELLTEPLIETVHQIAPQAFLREPEMIPAHAAAKMAFKIYRDGI
jgi:N-acetylglucosamine kinase-like BadF-type ATPase